MNFDPQKFFIGLMDFFSILLPGALLTYLAMNEVGQFVLGDRYFSIAGSEAWALFLFVSYLAGHMVFLLGSWLDGIYDWARKHTLNTQIFSLAHRDHLLPWVHRALIWMVFKNDRNVALKCAGRIKQSTLDPIQAAGAINNFQWCKALLNISSPSSLDVIQRFEADSKFFRCFTVVLLLLIALWPLQNQWPPAGIVLVLGMFLLALWRYMELRFKATKQAYWSVVTLTGQNARAESGSAEIVGEPRSHAGGIVLRRRCGKLQCLLVESTTNPPLWELPSGSVEDSEHPAETAIRKVREVTGIWAGICRDGDEWLSLLYGEPHGDRYYVMHVRGRGRSADTGQRHEWVTLEEAARRAKGGGTIDLLFSAMSVVTRKKMM